MINLDDENEILFDKIKKLSDKFNEKLLSLIKEFVVKGNLEVNPDLADLDSNIFDELKKITPDLYEYILAIFNEINKSNIDYYAKITNISRDITNSQSVKYVLDNLKVSLTGSGLKSNLAKQIANTIRPFILARADYKTTANAIKNVIPETMQRYLGNMTKGVFSVYDGAIQNTLKIKYNAKEFYYDNGLIETSRPFCIHMKEKYGSRKISFVELETDLAEFCPNGKPSEEMTTNLKGKSVKKGSGMMQGTTVATFPIFKGGADNGCNHFVRVIL